MSPNLRNWLIVACLVLALICMCVWLIGPGNISCGSHSMSVGSGK